MKILMGGGLSPSAEQAATRLLPPMDTIHAHHGLVLMRCRVGTAFIREVVILRNIYEASDDRDKAPQQRADPFPFATPRIPKSDGQRADPSSPSEPISARKVQQHDVASYALPRKPNR